MEKEKYFPIRRDAEDEIFIICMSELKEFPEHITKLDDIIGKYDSRYISKSYKNLNLDSVMERNNKNLINIEHHSNINSDLMRRDYEYCITVHAASKRYVKPFIFYTGELPIIEVEYANNTMFYNPQWIKTRKIDGNIRLNNIKYKIEKQEPSTVHDIIDLIWLPKYQIDLTIEDTVLLCIELWKNMIAEKWLLDIAKKCLKLWVGRYIEDEKQLKKAVGGLIMSALELRPFEEQLANVIYANRLEQAEKKGIKKGKGFKKGEEKGFKKGEEKGFKKGEEKGFKKGEENVILKLLEKDKPEEISEKYNIPLEKIEKIQNTK